MLSLEVVGSRGAEELTHKGPICVNTAGFAGGFVISTTIVLVVAHWPEAGVNVYVVVPTREVLMTAGFHAPLIPLFDMPGRAGAALF